MKSGLGVAALFLLVAACDGSTAPGNSGSVAVRFGLGSASAVSANVAASGAQGPAADELTLTGTNATIVIEDIRFIVEQMELRSSNTSSSCTDANETEHNGGDNNVETDRQGSGDNAEGETECEVQGGPFIVDLPLTGDVTVATDNVPAGTYDSFKFKIDDLEADDSDEADDRAQAPSLLAEIRTVYPNFPSRASLVVKGTQNGQPFTVYFRAKIQIAQPIAPPLTIPGDKALTVKIDPSAWFKIGNQVLNLLALNGQLVEFGAQFENGISGVRRGDH